MQQFDFSWGWFLDTDMKITGSIHNRKWQACLLFAKNHTLPSK
jgi:hypothetical protein